MKYLVLVPMWKLRLRGAMQLTGRVLIRKAMLGAGGAAQVVEYLLASMRL
jgi:hypothetical protein